MPSPRASSAAIAHAIRGALAAGLDIGAVEVTRDGTIRILAPNVAGGLSQTAQGGNSCDALFTGSNSNT